MTTTEPTTGAPTKTFADFNVDSRLCDALTEAGITHPFPIQELTLPVALSGADIIGQARTGTGKTLAFGLPMLQRLDAGKRETQVLVVVPTRELCLQVATDLTNAGAHKDVHVVAVYGGKSIEPQIREVSAGAAVVVGTPGRLLDLKSRGILDLSTVTGLVLDEADEMLDLGFLPDVEQLIEATAADRQTLLFSATMPSAVVSLARRYMNKPTFLRADVEEIRIAPETRQHFFSCHRMDKPAVLARILQAPDRGLCLVFSRTKRMADILANELRDRGIAASPIHSDLRQEARERALDRFRKGKIDVLVATEVAARGLDIDDVTHVVNYDCPDDEKMYLHRIGRTGRAGAAGVAVTLAMWNELARLEMIKRTLEIEEPTHEVFSTSEILDELFDLPARDARRPARAVDDDEDAPREAAPQGRRGGQDRSGGKRGGRRSGRQQSDQDRKPRTDKPAAAAERAPAASRDGNDAAKGTDGTDGTVRKRVRRRTTGAADAAETSTRTDVPAEADASGADAGDDAPRRSRTRARSGGRSTSRGSNSRSGGSSTKAPAERTSAAADTGVEPDERRARSAATRRDSSEGQGQGQGQSQGHQGKSRGQSNRSGSGSRSGSRSGSGSGRRQAGRSDTGRSNRAAAVTADEARGEGNPRLRRRLEVVHLP